MIKNKNIILNLKVINMFSMIDFVLTYLSINILNFIEEKNFFMAWLFELDFFKAIVVYVAIIALKNVLILSVLRYYKSSYYIAYNNVVKFNFLVYIIVFSIHFDLIYNYILL